MQHRVLFTLAAIGAAGIIAFGVATIPVAAQAGATGTIIGHVKYMGPTPVNPLIRMGADPRCNKLYAGKRPRATTFIVAADGGMANVFVNLEGSFANAPAAPATVVVDQKDCMYQPHVSGARIGQTLQVKNSDDTGHNVHSLSMAGNNFNTSEPAKGMVFETKLKAGEMLHIKCDIHAWMNTYIGILDHPYFAVSGTDGTFTIANVPAGRQTVRAWHEAMGVQTQTVDVQSGKMTTVDFTFMPRQKQSAAVDLHELIIPADVKVARITVLP